LIPVFLF
jgi:hypothetical protein